MTEQKQSLPEEKKGYSYPEIQDIEADRKDAEKWNVIHLLRDGNYWHANEWSGWLVAVVIQNEMKRRQPDVERVPPMPVKKFAKNINGEYIFVGFQEKSFDKYIPKEMQMSWVSVDNTRIDVGIELPAELGELSYERLQEMYLKWKAAVPLQKEKKEKGGKSGDDRQDAGLLPFGDDRRTAGIMAIVTRLLSFPLHKRTPQQAVEFIGEMQQELIGHL